MEQPERKNRGGRPKKAPGEVRNVSLNMRTTKGLRERMEIAAKASGRSLAQEVEHRLSRSFEMEDAATEMLGGERMLQLFKTMAAIAGEVATRTGARPEDDHRSWKAFEAAAVQILKVFKPSPSASELAELQELYAGVQKLQEIRPAFPAGKPTGMRLTDLLGGKPSDEDLAEHARAMAEWDKAYAPYKAELERRAAESDRLREIGGEIAEAIVDRMELARILRGEGGN